MQNSLSVFWFGFCLLLGLSVFGLVVMFGIGFAGSWELCLLLGLSVSCELCLLLGLSVSWGLCLVLGLCVCGLVCDNAF